MHQENPKYTRMQVSEMMKVARELQESDPETYNNGVGKELELNIHFGKEHDSIVKKFGRYPHRNEVMGRESTPEELQFLKDAARYG